MPSALSASAQNHQRERQKEGDDCGVEQRLARLFPCSLPFHGVKHRLDTRERLPLSTPRTAETATVEPTEELEGADEDWHEEEGTVLCVQAKMPHHHCGDERREKQDDAPSKMAVRPRMTEILITLCPNIHPVPNCTIPAQLANPSATP